MKFDEDLQAYVFETDGVIFSWEEGPEGDCETAARTVAAKYREKLPGIIAYMLPDLREMYGEVEAGEAAEKLGPPIIAMENGTMTWCEQEFDSVHIFTLEYLDDEFEELQYFSVDG